MSNIATMIMEGVNPMGGSSNVSLYGDYDFSNSVVEESSYVTSAIATLYTDIMEADQSYMVSDVIATATIVRESSINGDFDRAKAIAVSEGVFKNAIDKIVAGFKKFIAKIKEYYNRVINWFKAMFSNAEDFAKNYGSMITEKFSRIKGYEYKGYPYDLSAGDAKVKSCCESVKGEIQNQIGGFDYSKGATKDELYAHMTKDGGKASKNFDASKETTSASELVDKFISGSLRVNGASDSSELRTNLVEIYQGGVEAKESITNFEKCSISTMLEFLKGSSKTITKLQSQLQAYENSTKGIITKLNSLKPNDSESKEEKAQIAHCSHISSILTSFLNLYKIPCDVQIGVYKAVSSEWLGALKGFYNYKGNNPNKKVEESLITDTVDSIALLETTLFEGCGGGKGGKDDEGDEPEDPATESTLAGILEAANAYL